jgi:hypothetical protein
MKTGIMNMKTLHIYSDPGHGWLRVKMDLIKTLGIENKITFCSYQRNDWVYLEEDCDASTFMLAIALAGLDFKYKSHYSNSESKIRTYKRYYHDSNN